MTLVDRIVVLEEAVRYARHDRSSCTEDGTRYVTTRQYPPNDWGDTNG